MTKNRIQKRKPFRYNRNLRYATNERLAKASETRGIRLKDRKSYAKQLKAVRASGRRVIPYGYAQYGIPPR